MLTSLIPKSAFPDILCIWIHSFEGENFCSLWKAWKFYYESLNIKYWIENTVAYVKHFTEMQNFSHITFSSYVTEILSPTKLFTYMVCVDKKCMQTFKVLRIYLYFLLFTLKCNNFCMFIPVYYCSCHIDVLPQVMLMGYWLLWTIASIVFVVIQSWTSRTGAVFSVLKPKEWV